MQPHHWSLFWENKDKKSVCRCFVLDLWPPPSSPTILPNSSHLRLSRQIYTLELRSFFKELLRPQELSITSHSQICLCDGVVSVWAALHCCKCLLVFFSCLGVVQLNVTRSAAPAKQVSVACRRTRFRVTHTHSRTLHVIVCRCSRATPQKSFVCCK